MTRSNPWAAIAAFLLATAAVGAGAQNQQSPDQVFNDAKSLGSSQATSGASQVRTGSNVNLTPNYNPNPPQKSIYSGGGDASAQINAQKTTCQANSNDPMCAGVALGSTQQPTPTISASDPALAGQSVVANPTTVLGDIAKTYSACTLGPPTLVSPAQYSTQACTLDTPGWQPATCSKNLSVVPHTRTTCTQGTWFIVSSTSIQPDVSVAIYAYCDISAADQQYQMKVYSQSYGLDVTTNFSLYEFNALPGLGGNPPVVASQLLTMTWNGDTRWFDVYVFGQNCSVPDYSNCALTFKLFVGSQTCNGIEGGPCVDHPAGSLEGKRQCPNGETVGSELIFKGSCDLDNNCTYNRGDASTCWRPAVPADKVVSAAYGLMQTPEQIANWFLTQDASTPTQNVLYVPGDPINEVRSFAANYQRPAAPFITSESWGNGCSALDAATPGKPADGAISDANSATLPTGPTGSQRCVRTASVCADAHSTKVIDGQSVYRDCWSWVNSYMCATLDNNSTCGALDQNGCQAQTELQCTAFDGAGRCISGQRTYQCKTAEAVYAPATNCNNANFCAGGSCWDTSSAPNNNMAPAVAQLQARMDAGKDFDPSKMRVFSGASNACSKYDFGTHNCCNQGGGWLGCPGNDQQTAVKRDKGLCHLVGDFCSHHVFLLGCATRQYTYCCYSGMLARVVQEQGHNQVGKSWGTPENPDCSGFTVDQFASLNWGAIDLSEWYSQINPVPPNLAAIQSQNQGQQTSCYYGNGKCGP